MKKAVLILLGTGVFLILIASGAVSWTGDVVEFEGMTFINLDERQLAAVSEASGGQASGISIAAVAGGSAADRAGVLAGDILIMVRRLGETDTLPISSDPAELIPQTEKLKTMGDLDLVLLRRQPAGYERMEARLLVLQKSVISYSGVERATQTLTEHEVSAEVHQKMTHTRADGSRPDSSCADDAMENNDTRSTATRLMKLNDTVTGLILCPGDEDHFEIVIPPYHTIDVEVETADTAPHLNVSSFIREQGFSSSHRTDQSRSLNLYRPMGGATMDQSESYYVAVIYSGSPGSPPVPYTINIKGTKKPESPKGPCPPPDPAEPNDLPSQALRLPLSRQRMTRLSVCKTDVDNFVVSLPPGVRASLIVEAKESDGSLVVASRTNAGDYGATHWLVDNGKARRWRTNVQNSEAVPQDSHFYIAVSEDRGSPGISYQVWLEAHADRLLVQNDVVTTARGESILIDPTLNDLPSASNMPIAVTFVGSASHGKVTLEADGRVRYTPVPNFIGIDYFEYTITQDNSLFNRPNESALGRVAVRVGV